MIVAKAKHVELAGGVSSVAVSQCCKSSVPGCLNVYVQ